MTNHRKCWTAVLCMAVLIIPFQFHSRPQQDSAAQIDALLKQANEQMYVTSQLKDGEDTAKRALDLSRKSADRPRTMKSLHALSSFYFYVARFPEALELEQESLGIAREIGDKRNLSVALNGMAAILRALGRFEESLTYF